VVHQGAVIGGGTWPPIIEEDTHHGIVAYLSDPARIKKIGFERVHEGSGVYRCGVCGGPLFGWKPAGNKGRAYVCPNNRHVRRQGEALDAYIDAIVLGRLS